MIERIEKIIMENGEMLFLYYFLIGIVPLLICRTEWNLPFFIAFKYLLIPIATLSYLSIFILEEWRSNSSLVGLIIWPLVIALLLTLASGGYLVAINMLGYKNNSLYAGEITRKSISTGRYPSFLIEIYDSKTNNTIQLPVPSREYDKLKKGDLYSCRWRDGLLRIPFKMIWE